jgi:hypothetical protein
VGERLFLFVQLEFPWELGPADGRYVLRGEAGGEPERVVILETIGATPRRGRLAARRRPPVEPQPEPTTVPIARVTVIDPVSVGGERQARVWLAQLDTEREVGAAAAIVNRVLYAHRTAAADPCVRELGPAQALTVRAGWGEGEQVAYGQWTHARELRFTEHRRRRRAVVLRPQERLAALLGAREAPLLCEELALRARLDLDQGRSALAAVELDRAYAAALVELPAQQRADLDARIAELRKLHSDVSAAARAAIDASAADCGAADDGAVVSTSESGAGDGGRTRSQTGTGESDTELLSHALTRLEAALRARTAAGIA